MKIFPGCAAAVSLLCFIMLLGCGGYNSNNNTTTTTNCNPTGLSVFPNTSVLTHNSAGSAQQFGAVELIPAGCTQPTIAPFTITWSTSNLTDVPISNNHDTTNGIATCMSPASEPVTVIATLPNVTETGVSGTVNVTGTATITCN